MGGIFSVYWRFLGILVGAHVCLEVLGTQATGWVGIMDLAFFPVRAGRSLLYYP